MIITFDVETTGLHHKKDSLLSLSYLYGTDIKEVIYPYETYYATENIYSTFDQIIEMFPNATYVGHNIKFDLRFLDISPDVVDRLNIIDTTILYHYLFPREEKKLGSIEKHLYKTNVKEKYLETYGKKFDLWPKEELEKYNKLDVELTYKIYKKLIGHIDERFLNFQTEYLKALYRIEYFGIGFDQDKAKEESLLVRDLADSKEIELRDWITSEFGYDVTKLNFNSSKQLSNLLYVDMDIPRPDRNDYPNGKAFDKLFTATLTNADLLETIKHPFITKFLEWKKVTAVQKSIDSYADLAHDNRLYPSFNITGTRTGRLSCLAVGSKVLTKDGYKNIESIVEGDYVLSHLDRWQPVLHLIDNGIDDTYNITFCNGYILTCNKSHSILTDVGWVTIDQFLTGEINYEYIKVLGKESREYNKGIRDVSVKGYTYFTDNSGSIRYNLSQHSFCSETESVCRRETSPKESTLFQVKDGGEKPYGGKVRRTTPQLYRRMRRWLRVSNMCSQWETSICTQGSNGRCFGSRGSARNIFSSSYRSKPQKQFTRKFSSLYSLWPQADTLHVSERYTFYTIEKVEFAGSARVFDLTVANDHSYLSGFIFSHNCSQPNLQNIAKDKKGLPSVRTLFRPNSNETLVSIDYQQQEIRMLAILSQDEDLLSLVKQGVDMHTVVGKQMFRKDEITKEERDIIKNIHFAMLYGLSMSAIAFKIGSDIQYASHLVETYYDSFPKVYDFMEKIKTEAKNTSEISLFTGRIWHCLPGMEYQAINAVIQGSCAELTALSVIKNSKYLRKTGFGSILSIIHDETLYSLNNLECIPEIVERMQMNNLFGIPFLVDVDYNY